MDDRKAKAATLRALAALLDDESIPAPRVDSAVIWIRDDADGAATAARIMKTLGGTWTAQERNWGPAGGSDYLEITGILPGPVKVDIEVPLEQAGHETGSRVVKEYEPVPVIAELLASPAIVAAGRETGQ